MRIRPILFGVFVLFIFLGIIFGFQSAGVWSISGKITSSGEAVKPSSDDVESIKGWMSLGEITTAYNVTLPELIAQFHLPTDTPATTAIKDLESEDFSVTNLRTWLTERTSPAQSEARVEPTLKPTLNIETTTDTLSSEPTGAPLPTQHIVADKTLTGKTTFQELLDWGVSREVIQQIIGGDLPAPSTMIKNFITGQGLEFAPIKSALQAEVDKTK